MRYFLSDNPGPVVFGCILLIVVIGMTIFVTTSTRNNDYKDFRNHAVSDTWSPGTLDSAKFVVTECITKAKKPGDLHISTYQKCIFARSSNPAGYFNSQEICYKDVHMLLTKRDYIRYIRWLKKISKPYIAGKKFLNPPLLPPPWDI